jgi:hypothetical protein
MISLAYDGELDFNNTKGLLFKATFTGDYGVNGVGDLLNLEPTQNAGVDGGVTDPNLSYNEILNQPTTKIFVLNDNLGGYYTQVAPNAAPTLKNTGLRVFASEGGELATNAAYGASITGGSTEILVLLPAQQ